MTHQELQDLPIAQQRMILRDRSQKYQNMLTCVHDLTATERKKLSEWMIQTDEMITNLPEVTDDEVAIHP